MALQVNSGCFLMPRLAALIDQRRHNPRAARIEMLGDGGETFPGRDKGPITEMLRLLAYRQFGVRFDI
jgi:hypothetical protein